MCPPDFEGEFHLFGGAANARKYSGYRPQHEVHDNYQTSGIHAYIGREFVDPGETVLVQVQLITPEVYPRCLWEDRQLKVLEGAKQVGSLRVTNLLNASLRVAPDAYEAVWVEPESLGDVFSNGKSDG
jgi:translation elongation factor EF-Tu-like GTPase